MRIGGFQKLTLVDYPGKIAATVFTQGCNFRCGFCHNPELVLPQLFQTLLSEEEVLSYLNDHREKLQGIVITGGEPTIQKGLASFIARIKNMGLSIKLDTNGSHPEVLSSLIELKLIDYIAMDIKSSMAKYSLIVGVSCDTNKIQESINLIIQSKIPYQLRTTLVKEFSSNKELSEIKSLIKAANHYVFQPFVSSKKIIDGQYNLQRQYSEEEVKLLQIEYGKIL